MQSINSPEFFRCKPEVHINPFSVLGSGYSGAKGRKRFFILLCMYLMGHLAPLLPGFLSFKDTSTNFSSSPVAPSVKSLPCSMGDLGSIPGSERSPGEGNGYPLQHSCLENSMDGGALWATVHGVTKSRTQLSD